MDVTRPIRYNHALWNRFADYFVTECSWEELSRNHETSHNTIANVTMHAVNMEDWWLHYVLVGREWDGPAWDGFTSATAMRDRVREVAEKTEKLLASATHEDLTRKRVLRVGDDEFETTLEDLLVEVVNENAHHRGEVLAMLWRMDKEPPYFGFLDFEG